jgi:hypothetical protein
MCLLRAAASGQLPGMRTLTLAVMVAGSLAGCIESDPDGVAGEGSGSGSGSGSGAPIDASHATPCEGTTVMQGVDVPASVKIPSRSFDVSGALFCLELDARQNIQVAHFAAGTAYEQGTASSFVLALFGNGDGTMLQDGWDVELGSGTSFANLEYGVTKGDYIAVKLFVAAKAASAATEVSLSLFEPYE